MKRVFLSSVVKGFEHLRDAAAKAIEGLEGFTCIRMENFAASPDPALEVCLENLSKCDYYVGILGSKYGSIHSGWGCSYTEAEYRRAVDLNIPRLMFLARIDVIGEQSEDLAAMQREFRKRVSGDHFRSEFLDADELRAEITRALANCALTTAGKPVDAANETWLFVPFVTAQAGYDSGVAVTNPDLSILGYQSLAGKCTIYYVGETHSRIIAIDQRAVGNESLDQFGGLTPIVQDSAVIPPSKQLTFVLTTGGSFGIAATPGFQGYLLIHCRFPNARAVSFISKQGERPDGAISFPVEVLRPAQ